MARPAGEVVEDRETLGDPHRIVPGEHSDHGPELDPGRLSGQPRQDHRRLRRQLVVGEVVLGDPSRVEADLLGPAAEAQLAAVDLGVRAIPVKVLEGDSEPYVHEHLLSYLAPRRHTLHLSSGNGGPYRSAESRTGPGQSAAERAHDTGSRGEQHVLSGGDEPGLAHQILLGAVPEILFEPGDPYTEVSDLVEVHLVECVVGPAPARLGQRVVLQVGWAAGAFPESQLLPPFP